MVDYLKLIKNRATSLMEVARFLRVRKINILVNQEI